jgi:hypothetical protein
MRIDGRRHRVAAALLVSLLGPWLGAACKGDGAEQDGQPGAAEVLELGLEAEGIYEIVDHLTDIDGCDPEEQILTAGFPLLALYAVSSSGRSAVSLFTCTDVESCRAGVDAIEAGRSISTNFHWSFDVWRGDGSVAGTNHVVVQTRSLCRQTLTDLILRRELDSTLRVEAREWRGEDFAAADGNCPAIRSPLDKGGQPCSRLKTFGAQLVDTL